MGENGVLNCGRITKSQLSISHHQQNGSQDKGHRITTYLLQISGHTVPYNIHFYEFSNAFRNVDILNRTELQCVKACCG